MSVTPVMHVVRDGTSRKLVSAHPKGLLSQADGGSIFCRGHQDVESEKEIGHDPWIQTASGSRFVYLARSCLIHARAIEERPSGKALPCDGFSFKPEIGTGGGSSAVESADLRIDEVKTTCWTEVSMFISRKLKKSYENP